jgi:hypothetical protein
MTTTVKSLLSKKDQSLSDNQKVQKLVRIGRRALGKADHMETTVADYYRRCGTPEDLAQCLADAAKARARATAATDEMAVIARQTDDLYLARKARVAGIR